MADEAEDQPRIVSHLRYLTLKYLHFRKLLS